VKLSVSLSDADVAALDDYAQAAGLGSRSAALQHAIRLLRHADLEQDYAQAWDEWTAADRGVWERSTGDGLD
jgi:metal-responsive CopG/Arc/MetJ family transcriptional regulator